MVSSLVRQYYQLNDKHFKFIPHNPDVAPSDNDAFILFSMAMLSEGVGESGSIWAYIQDPEERTDFGALSRVLTPNNQSPPPMDIWDT